MGRMAFALVLGSVLSIAGNTLAQAQDVDIALALVSDVSSSIDDHEYELEKDGYVQAFDNQQVMDAIQGGPLGKIAVVYIEFSSEAQVKTVLDWTVIRDATSAHAFARQLVASPRSFSGRTAIGAGLDRALQRFTEAGIKATRRVIDICGDGTSNDGPDVSNERDKALQLGVVINGLAIVNESSSYVHMHPPGGLARYYQDNVTGGPNSFVVEVHDFATIGRAMIHKLLTEIATGRSGDRWAIHQTGNVALTMVTPHRWNKLNGCTPALRPDDRCRPLP